MPQPSTTEAEKLLAEVVIPQTELRPIGSLIRYARNSRKHSDAQIQEVIIPSMMEFGWTYPVLADDSGVVCGHGRLLAADQLYANGHTIKFPNGSVIPLGFVPVIDCTGWSEEQRRAYVIMDNRSAEKGASWDVEMLKLETQALMEAGYDLSLTGFTTDELAEMFALAELPPQDKNPDDCPSLPDEPHSMVGDVWLLGPHRVVCGDSTDIGVWDALMAGELADGAWCDPPYNVDYESDVAGKIKNDKMDDSDFREMLLGMFRCMWTVMKQGASAYVAHADTEGRNFRNAFEDAGFKLSGCLIWKKDSLVLGRSDYQWMHEPILYGWKPGSKHKWFGGRKQTTIVDHGVGGPIRQLDDGRWVIEVGDQVLVVDGAATLEGFESSIVFHEKPKRSAEHPTMKPVGLIEKQLKSSCRPMDIVVDCCGGSGSTLIACDRLNMIARLVELDPKFVDVICQRYFEYTGRVPVHADSGEKFPVKREAA